MRIIEYYVDGLRYEYYNIDFNENSIKLKLCVLCTDYVFRTFY